MQEEETTNNEGPIFPPTEDVMDSKISGDPRLVNWATDFLESGKQASIFDPSKIPWQGVNLCTEFSGSGCPEAMLHCVCSHMGLHKDKVSIGYAADINKDSRRVLLNSRQGFS